MGKTSRKTLAKKKDFNKVKLKVGKKKPLANNATETSFKSQSIYLKEQLKNQNQVEHSNRTPYNVTDLLSHLNHFNASFRLRALNALRDALVNNHEKALDAASLVEKVSKCVMDDDDEVRKACIVALQHIFMDLPEAKMSPYFPLVLSHLYCAMSHLSKDVQKDSLKIVDLLLQHYPGLVSKQANTKLLQYFLELISTKENCSAMESRKLTMQLSLKKESATMWRNRVLSRIHALLKMSVIPTNTTSKKEEEKKVLWNCQHVGNMLIPVCCQNKGFLLKNIHMSDIITSSRLSQEELIATVTPILVQCWLDVCGSGFLAKDAETIDTMFQVLSIIYTMMSQLCVYSEDMLASIDWIRKSFLCIFNKHFFINFPIVQPEILEMATRRKNKKLEETIKKTVPKINLLICNLFALITTDEYMSNDHSKISAIVDYIFDFISSSLTSSSSINNDLFESMMSCIEKLIRLKNIKDLQNSLVTSLYEYSRSSKCSSYHKGMILRSMMELFEQLRTLPENSSFYDVLSDLPLHLLSAFEEIVRKKRSGCKIEQVYLKSVEKCIQLVGRRRNKTFLHSLSNQFFNIMNFLEENSSDIFCSDNLCPNCVSFQISLFDNTLPLVLSLNEKDFNILSRLCKNDHMTQRADYIIDLLAHRVDSMLYWNRERSNDEKIGLLKFLFTLLLSGSYEDSKPECSTPLSGSIIAQHSRICHHIEGCLKRFCLDNSGLKKFIGRQLKTKLELAKFERIEATTILGILVLGKVYTSSVDSLTDCCGIGRFLSRLLLTNMNCCERNEMKKYIIELLEEQVIMKSCLDFLTASESMQNITTITTLMKIDDLQEYFLPHSCVIKQYIKRITKLGSNTDAASNLKAMSSLLVL